jgi:aminoglycoside 6'-N-acetyltransferase
MGTDPGKRDMKIHEHNISLSGEDVLLRPMTEDDWDILLKWNNDPEVLYFSEGDNITSQGLERVQQKYRGVSRKAFCFIIEIENIPVGDCWLQEMNLERILKKYPGKDCRCIDLMIGEKHLWGKGIGTDVIATLTRFGFEIEKADCIFGCDVANYNPRSQKAFEKNGYHIVEKIELPPGSKGKFDYDFLISREEFYK